MQISKYLLANERDALWGLTVSTIGYEHILPGDPYPTKGHADGHYFDQFFTPYWWPTLRWIASFVVLTWKYYAVYIPVVLLVFFLPTLLHNIRISKKIDSKKKLLAEKLKARKQ